jgi:cytochrome c oxidase assembly protein subunit 15
MNGNWIPDDLFEYEPFITNFFENSGLVQFNHRLTAYLLFIVVSIIWWANRRNPYLKIRVATNYLMIIVVVQMFLGIITVLYSAPLSLASLHQFTAILFILAYINLFFKTYYPVSQKI